MHTHAHRTYKCIQYTLKCITNMPQKNFKVQTAYIIFKVVTSTKSSLNFKQIIVEPGIYTPIVPEYL